MAQSPLRLEGANARQNLPHLSGVRVWRARSSRYGTAVPQDARNDQCSVLVCRPHLRGATRLNGYWMQLGHASWHALLCSCLNLRLSSHRRLPTLSKRTVCRSSLRNPASPLSSALGVSVCSGGCNSRSASVFRLWQFSELVEWASSSSAVENWPFNRLSSRSMPKFDHRLRLTRWSSPPRGRYGGLLRRLVSAGTRMPNSQTLHTNSSSSCIAIPLVRGAVILS